MGITDRSVKQGQSTVGSRRGDFSSCGYICFILRRFESRGRDEEEREAPDGTRVRQLWTELCAEVPRFAVPSMPPAPNREYVSADSALADDDEVVLLPPRRMRKN